RSDRSMFELVSVLAPPEQLAAFQGEAASKLWDYYVRPEGVLFVIHPEAWSCLEAPLAEQLRALPRGESICVAPTASTRTVLTVNGLAGAPTHFLKLHYPRRISRFNRRLRFKNIHN